MYEYIGSEDGLLYFKCTKRAVPEIITMLHNNELSDEDCEMYEDAIILKIVNHRNYHFLIYHKYYLYFRFGQIAQVTLLEWFDGEDSYKAYYNILDYNEINMDILDGNQMADAMIEYVNEISDTDSEARDWDENNEREEISSAEEIESDIYDELCGSESSSE